MVDTWAISGVDLHLDLRGPRVREGLEKALRDAVQSGRLTPGMRLPSSRSLAADLGLARNTVSEVYAQLVAEGWLVARQGSGTRVAERPVVEPDVADTAARRARPAVRAAPPLKYDLKPGSPDLSMFPRAEWATTARRALLATPAAAFGYGDPRGLAELRHTLAHYLARARGVRTTASRIVVCSGYVQALALLSAVLRRRGGAVAVEALGLRVHRNVITAAGLATLPMPVDGDGAVTDRLHDMPVAAALVTAAHQFPTGVVLAPHRRAAAVEWARSTGGLVIEDDYDGEFRYDRQPVGALQALDPDRVVYTGTASKSLAPGLRLAWMALPPSLVDEVIAAKEVTDLYSGTFEQLTLADYMASGAFDRHVRRCRLHYRRRRDRLAAVLAERVPHVAVSGIAAGLHAMIELPTGWSEEAVIGSAARRGVHVGGLAEYRYGPEESDRPALVVGYGTPPEHAFTGALDELAASLRHS